MTDLLTSAQMRALEQSEIAAGRVSGPELMERAARGFVAAVFDHYPDLGADRPAGAVPPHSVVLCGPGNNGGDGFVVARLLRQAGWTVEVIYTGGSGDRPSAARMAHGGWSALGEVQSLDRAGNGTRPDLLIDALLGIGVSRPLTLEWAQAWQAVKSRAGDAPCHVVAVDCPSGFDCDAGGFILPDVPDDAQSAARFRAQDILPRELFCDLCVTFHAPKVGHYMAEAAGNGTRPAVVDIGLPGGPWTSDPGRDSQSDGLSRLIAPEPGLPPQALRIWLENAAYPQMTGSSHKYDRGHALVLAGGPGHGGAGRMAARAALRIGAGLVTLGVPQAAMAENAAQLNAVMLAVIDDAEALAETLQDDRLSAVCIGPGLGIGDRTRALVAAACTARASDRTGELRRIVLDADALTSFADAPDRLFGMVHDSVVLTPHEGEFARLFPDLSARGAPRMSRVNAAQAAARRAGCFVLLKGPATVIASPDGVTSIHAALYERRVPWLGTAGAGDVLAGLMTGLLAAPQSAQRMQQILEAAAYLHVEAAREIGPGLIAEDLPDVIPQVLRRHGL